MSKYIIDTETWANLFEVQRVGVYGIGNDIVTDEKTVWSRMFSLDELEELNSDYINEHYGQMQDEAYKQGYADAERIWRAPSSDNEFYRKGLEDGKKSIDNGCNGCKYEDQHGYDEPCNKCMHSHASHYTPMPKQDDSIKVGDIVERYVDGKLDSKGIYLQEDDGYWRCLFDTGAVLMTFAYPKGQFKKTGKHYDIASILEAMRA